MRRTTSRPRQPRSCARAWGGDIGARCGVPAGRTEGTEGRCPPSLTPGELIKARKGGRQAGSPIHGEAEAEGDDGHRHRTTRADHQPACWLRAIWLKKGRAIRAFGFAAFTTHRPRCRRRSPIPGHDGDLGNRRLDMIEAGQMTLEHLHSTSNRPAVAPGWFSNIEAPSVDQLARRAGLPVCG